jgi:hypothetical protein
MLEQTKKKKPKSTPKQVAPAEPKPVLADEARISSSAAPGSTEDDRRRSEKLKQKQRKMQEIGHLGEAAEEEDGGGLSLKAAIRDSKKKRQQ